jgi:hypothetical protein
MWASVIKGVGLNLCCFPFEFSAAVLCPLIPLLTGIATVAFSRFVAIGAITPNRLVGHGGGGFNVSFGHIDVARRV